MANTKIMKPVDTTQSAPGPSPKLVSGLPPGLTRDEALTPGVLKLLLREQEKSDCKLTELERNCKALSDDKTVVKEENAVLKTKLSYSAIWDVLITIAGICGGGVIATWDSSKGVSVSLGVLTVLLFLLAVLGRKK